MRFKSDKQRKAIMTRLRKGQFRKFGSHGYEARPLIVAGTLYNLNKYKRLGYTVLWSGEHKIAFVKEKPSMDTTVSERCLLHGHNYGKHVKDCPDYHELMKEHKEHPSFSMKQVKQIVKDHEYKLKLKRCERKVKKQPGYNPYAVCRASVKR